VPLALSTGQKTGLLIAAGIFIAFALISSFLFPRRNPDFPGRSLSLFVTVTLALFVGMMAAVVVLAKEDEAEGGGHEAAAETTGGTETGGATETGGSETGGAAQGDARAGKAVFESAGCGSCHTLADAGAKGQVGPSLDEAKPHFALVVTRVTNGKPPMPAFKDQLSQEQIRDVAAYVSTSAGA